MTKLPFKTYVGMTLGHLYPFLSGCGSFANSGLMRGFAPTSPCEVTIRVQGGQAHIPVNDYVGRAMLFVGDLDRKISRMVDLCVLPGDTALDIGANLGLVSLRLAGQVGSTGAVHAFEPSPRLAPYLTATIAANPALNITHHPVALGRTRASLPLHVPADNAGAATLRSTGAANAVATVEVQVHQLSDYATQIGLDRVDFIKIDVEGFEPEVLAGATALFERLRPKVVVLEENATVTPEALPEALQILVDQNYDIYALPKRLFRFELVELAHAHAASAHDYVAIARTAETNLIRGRLGLGETLGI